MHASLTQENIICVFIFVGEVHKYVNGSHFGYLLLPWQLVVYFIKSSIGDEYTRPILYVL